jgi:hypothetical protein
LLSERFANYPLDRPPDKRRVDILLTEKAGVIYIHENYHHCLAPVQSVTQSGGFSSNGPQKMAEAAQRIESAVLTGLGEFVFG